MTPEDILVELPELEPEIIGWRRHIHERPELSFEEHETAKFVEWKLRRWGLEPERPTPTSVVAERMSARIKMTRIRLTSFRCITTMDDLLQGRSL